MSLEPRCQIMDEQDGEMAPGPNRWRCRAVPAVCRRRRRRRALEASRRFDSGDSLKRRRMNTIVREIVREVIRVALPPLTKAVTKAVEAVFQRQPVAPRGPIVVSSPSPVSDDASVPDARLVDQLRKLAIADVRKWIDTAEELHDEELLHVMRDALDRLDPLPDSAGEAREGTNDED